MARFGATILGLIFGLLLGVGLGILLIQAGILDPLTSLGLVFPIGGLLLGFLVGLFGGRKRKVKPVPPPPPPPPAETKPAT